MENTTNTKTVAKKTIKVVTEFGTFARSTARNYKFLIIRSGFNMVNESLKWDRSLVNLRSNFAEYTAVVDGRQGTGSKTLTVDHFREWLSGVTQALDTFDADRASALAACEATNAARQFQTHGFSGNIQNARKSAASAADYSNEVKIIDVETGREVR